MRKKFGSKDEVVRELLTTCRTTSMVTKYAFDMELVSVNPRSILDDIYSRSVKDTANQVPAGMLVCGVGAGKSRVLEEIRVTALTTPELRCLPINISFEACSRHLNDEKGTRFPGHSLDEHVTFMVVCRMLASFYNTHYPSRVEQTLESALPSLPWCSESLVQGALLHMLKKYQGIDLQEEQGRPVWVHLGIDNTARLSKFIKRKHGDPLALFRRHFLDASATWERVATELNLPVSSQEQGKRLVTSLVLSASGLTPITYTDPSRPNYPILLPESLPPQEVYEKYFKQAEVVKQWEQTDQTGQSKHALLLLAAAAGAVPMLVETIMYVLNELKVDPTVPCINTKVMGKIVDEIGKVMQCHVHDWTLTLKGRNLYALVFHDVTVDAMEDTAQTLLMENNFANQITEFPVLRDGKVTSSFIHPMSSVLLLAMTCDKEWWNFYGKDSVYVSPAYDRSDSPEDKLQQYLLSAINSLTMGEDTSKTLSVVLMRNMLSLRILASKYSSKSNPVTLGRLLGFDLHDFHSSAALPSETSHRLQVLLSLTIPVTGFERTSTYCYDVLDKDLLTTLASERVSTTIPVCQFTLNHGEFSDCVLLVYVGEDQPPVAIFMTSVRESDDFAQTRAQLLQELAGLSTKYMHYHNAGKQSVLHAVVTGNAHYVCMDTRPVPASGLVTLYNDQGQPLRDDGENAAEWAEHAQGGLIIRGHATTTKNFLRLFYPMYETDQLYRPCTTTSDDDGSSTDCDDHDDSDREEQRVVSSSVVT